MTVTVDDVKNGAWAMRFHARIQGGSIYAYESMTAPGIGYSVKTLNNPRRGEPKQTRTFSLLSSKPPQTFTTIEDAVAAYDALRDQTP